MSWYNPFKPNSTAVPLTAAQPELTGPLLPYDAVGSAYGIREYVSGPSWVTTTGVVTQTTPTPSHAAMSNDIENNPAYTASVATLVDLWQQKFGNAWVDLPEVTADAFFMVAYTRLKHLGRLEEVYLYDKVKTVVRIPE
jgi:hypothetical protein